MIEEKRICPNNQIIECNRVLCSGKWQYSRTSISGEWEYSKQNFSRKIYGKE